NLCSEPQSACTHLRRASSRLQENQRNIVRAVVVGAPMWCCWWLYRAARTCVIVPCWIWKNTSLGYERNVNDFGCFVLRNRNLPLLRCFERSLNQNWAASQYLSRLNRAIDADYYVDFHGSLHTQANGQLRVAGGDPNQ